MSKTVANLLIIFLEIFFSMPTNADPMNLCRWTSVSECIEKAIGSTCKNIGICLAKNWIFSEPECKCYEKPDDGKNFCRSSSATECRDKLPGNVRGGICKITKIVFFSEPECQFIKE